MSRLLGVLPLHKSVILPGVGAHVLTEDDVDMWASNPGQTAVTFAGATGRNERLAGYCDKATINGGKLYLYGDLDPALPGGADARWGIRDTGVYDRLGARMLPRPDPLRAFSTACPGPARAHWGGFSRGRPGGARHVAARVSGRADARRSVAGCVGPSCTATTSHLWGWSIHRHSFRGR